MYLSQLILDRINRQIMKDLSDIYRLHQLIMFGFSEYNQPERILFRVEPETREQTVRILVQSQVKPTWEAKGYMQNGIGAVETKEIDFHIQPGSLYRFRLRANPVVTRKGKRYGLIRDEALIDWLQKKESNIGASFTSILPIDEGYITGDKPKVGRTDRINIKIARFEGMLKVNDPPSFNEALKDGIGSAKAFGCGLLSLAKA
ncbi:MAG: type I-E CRISPR-associated protein Cas6/Cse3/CasE [Deltaproteobacteria bacterium]|jgi:CRISPR system Cascade subunit CasE